MAIRGKNMVDLKEGNRSSILTLLHEAGGLSRKQLAARLNLTPAAITMLVSDMIEDHILQEVRVLEGNGSAGRKEIMVDLCSDLFFVVGVYYGVERAILSATDLHGTLLSSETFLYDYDGGADYVIGKICDLLSDLIRQGRQAGKICAGVGVSARGIVDDAAGVCHNSYGGWPERDVALRDKMSQLLHTNHVYLKQNVRALADAYIFTNHTQPIESLLFVKNDTGIGSALVINHQVYPGYRSNAAEMGHIVVAPGGKPCRCGGSGCLETISSEKSILRDLGAIFSQTATPALFRLAQGDEENITFDIAARAIQEGDAAVKALVDHAIDAFAGVLRVHLDILDVQKVVLHGRVFYHPYFFHRLLFQLNFDDRYPHLAQMLDTTVNIPNLDTLCSPILAIRAFFRQGGVIK